MSTLTKRIRKSHSGVEYQIEYRLAAAGDHSEYRVRRGACGTWTPWIQAPDMNVELITLGFTRRKPTLLNDFAFEALFGRGEITLTDEMVLRLAKSVTSSARSRHLYSRVKRLGENNWVIPASAVTDPKMYAWLHQIISDAL